MNAKAFHDKHGRERSEIVAVRAGTTYAYFLQIMYRNRFPSRTLAKRLDEASDHEMTWQELLSEDSADDQASSEALA